MLGALWEHTAIRRVQHNAFSALHQSTTMTLLLLDVLTVLVKAPHSLARFKYQAVFVMQVIGETSSTALHALQELTSHLQVLKIAQNATLEPMSMSPVQLLAQTVQLVSMLVFKGQEYVQAVELGHMAQDLDIACA